MKRLTAFLSAAVICASTAFFSIGTVINGGLLKNTPECVPLYRKLQQSYQKLSLALGKDCIGSYFITDNRIIRQNYGYHPETVQHNIGLVNSYADSLSGTLYWMVAPTAVGIYSDTLSSYAPQASEQTLLSETAQAVGENVSWIDLYGTMYAARDSYAYYRTDPRWTSYGAFCAYKTAIRKLGLANLGLDRYDIEHRINDFRGVFYQETQYDGIDADIIDLYYCQDGAEIKSITAPLSGISYDSFFQEPTAENPHSIFLAEQEPILNVETGVHNDKSLLVISDGYGSNFVPFLTQHYRSLTFVNLNSATPKDLHSVYADVYSQVLLLCSADTLASANGFAALEPET